MCWHNVQSVQSWPGLQMGFRQQQKQTYQAAQINIFKKTWFLNCNLPFCSGDFAVWNAAALLKHWILLCIEFKKSYSEIFESVHVVTM